MDHRDPVDRSEDLESRVLEVRLDNKETQDLLEYLEDLELSDYQDHVDRRYVSQFNVALRSIHSRRQC